MAVVVPSDLRLEEKPISRPTSPPPDADQTGQVCAFYPAQVIPT
jgi:hypothetical protein